MTNVNKLWELKEIEIWYGKRVLEYNSNCWKVRYRYKDQETEKELSVDRFWKALRKFHSYNDYVKPLIHIKEEK